MPSPENQTELTTAVSGSFKFKPEIDLLHEEFRDYNVVVLAPDTGWLRLPHQKLILPEDSDFTYRPLPTERGMGPWQIERGFLDAVDQADFLYVNDLEGYIGTMTSFEIGYAIANKPIYARKPINELLLEDYPVDWPRLLRERVKVLSPAEAVADFQERFGE
jgi:hypothetical protein